MSSIRFQLTLFVNQLAAIPIERIRKHFNPAQFALIAAHVTLCREEELADLDQVIENLTNLDRGALVIRFGRATRFAEGKGLLLPATEDQVDFAHLRQYTLKGLVDEPRTHTPHITLMHPRNSTCTDAIDRQIALKELPSQIEFRAISLIEQMRGEPWRVLRHFPLSRSQCEQQS